MRIATLRACPLWTPHETPARFPSARGRPGPACPDRPQRRRQVDVAAGARRRIVRHQPPHTGRTHPPRACVEDRDEPGSTRRPAAECRATQKRHSIALRARRDRRGRGGAARIPRRASAGGVPSDVPARLREAREGQRGPGRGPRAARRGTLRRRPRTRTGPQSPRGARRRS